MKINHSYILKYSVIFIAICSTIFISWRISQFTFNKINEPLQIINQRNPSLDLLNQLFKKVVLINNLQQINNNSTNTLQQDSLVKTQLSLYKILDSLKVLDTNLIDKIVDIEKLIEEREHLNKQFLQINTAYYNNDSLHREINEFTSFVQDMKKSFDKNLYDQTTEIKSHSIENEIPDTSQNRTFFDKLLGKKKPTKKEINHFVYEKIKVDIDTTILYYEDSVINTFSKAIANIEKNRIQQLQHLTAKKTQYDLHNSQLINRILTQIQDLEASFFQQNNINKQATINTIKNASNLNKNIILVLSTITILLTLIFIYDFIKINRKRKESLIQAKDALTLAQYKEDFLSQMSHELRSPLQSILGYSELAINNMQYNPNYYNNIHSSAQHLLQIVNHILDKASLEQGNITLHETPILLSEVMDEVAIITNQLNKNNKLNIHYNLNINKSTSIIGDALRLKQILINIISNAIKYTSYGYVEITINEKQYEQHIIYTFIIEDSGIGIHKDNIEKIFEPYYQSNEQHKVGNGLGLYIVKSLISLMNGNIMVTSEYNQGSTFTINIPFNKVISSAIELNKTNSTPIELHKDDIIWLIDDDPFILELYNKILQELPVKLQSFNNPIEVINTPIPKNLVAIIIDYRMEPINGLELINTIHTKASHYIHYILSTADTSNHLKNNQHIHYKLNKPFTSNEIISLFKIEDNHNNVNLHDYVSKEYWDEFKNDYIDLLRQDIIDIESLKEGDITPILHKTASRAYQLGFEHVGYACNQYELNIHRNNQEVIKYLQDHLASIIGN